MSLFNYTTINVRLNKANHTLIIELNRPEQNQKVNFEMLFELESILAWATNKVEISSILFTSSSDYFCQGFEESNLGETPDKMEKVLARLRKIIEALPELPQITICDLKKGAKGIGAEFSLFCDMRVAHENAEIAFNHLLDGVTPSCGGIALLSECAGQSVARQLVYTGKSVNAKKLESCGFLSEIYEDLNANEVISNVLSSVDQTSNVARIQTKMAFRQLITNKIENGLKIENKISKANLYTYDWKEAIKAKVENRDPNFMAAKSFTYALDRAKNELIEELKP